MPPILIRDAHPKEAALLSDLGRRTFVEAFAAQNDPEHMKRFLDGAYHESIQVRELEDPAFTTLLAFVEDEAVGFAQLRRGPSEPCVTGSVPVELLRLYVLARHLGFGVGRALMQACLERAAREGFDTVWLGVWEHNARAINFYMRHGFTRVGSHLFDVGGDLQTDFVFERSLLLL